METLEFIKSSTVKIVCMGDEKVGKTSLVEKYLMSRNYMKKKNDNYLGVNIYEYGTKINDVNYKIEFWDADPQFSFQTLLPSFHHQAHGGIIVFDALRQYPDSHIHFWYKHLRFNSPTIPVWFAINKIEENLNIFNLKLDYIESKDLPLFYVSASTGINVENLFEEAINCSIFFKERYWSFQKQINEDDLEKID